MYSDPVKSAQNIGQILLVRVSLYLEEDIYLTTRLIHCPQGVDKLVHMYNRSIKDPP